MEEKTIQQKLEEVRKQEEKLIFKSFSNKNALEIGLLIIEAAKEFDKPVAINSLKNGQSVFHYAMDHTSQAKI